MLDALLERGYEYAFVVELRQPRRGARPAHPRLVGARGAAVRDGGRRPHGGRPQGRPPRARRETAGSCCARPRRPPTRTSTPPGHRAATATSTPTTCGSTCARSRRRCDARDGVLGLPMIVNRKTVDPADSARRRHPARDGDGRGHRGVRRRARAARPARRFAPVKTTNDLLALRSDAYVLHEDCRVELAAERDGRRSSTSIPTTTSCVGDFEPRFPAGPPSLVACERLRRSTAT